MSKDGIRVFVRFRPENRREVALGTHDPKFQIKFYPQDSRQLSIRHPSIKRNPRVDGSQNGQFDFVADKIFATDSTQTLVFKEVAFSTCQDIMTGYNGTIMAYGQTGSGKTYCMFGPSLEDLKPPSPSKKSPKLTKKKSSRRSMGPNAPMSPKNRPMSPKKGRDKRKSPSRTSKKSVTSRNTVLERKTSVIKNTTVKNPTELVCEKGEASSLKDADLMEKYQTLMGIVPRCAEYLFRLIAESEEIDEATIKVSVLEIYCEMIRDLLVPSNANLKIKQESDGTYGVRDIFEEYVSSPAEITELVNLAMSHRATASTGMNQSSSRSHCVLIITVTQKLLDGSTKTAKLNLADLAGSEKVRNTGSTGMALKEAQKINQSLSALGNCINALTAKKKGHVPFRDSKLTFLLKDSLGGNCKTSLVVTCSPCPSNREETLSTLRFAHRAKSIKTKAKINQQRSIEELMILVARLEKELCKYKNTKPPSKGTSPPDDRWVLRSEHEFQMAQLRKDLEIAEDENQHIRLSHGVPPMSQNVPDSASLLTMALLKKESIKKKASIKRKPSFKKQGSLGSLRKNKKRSSIRAKRSFKSSENCGCTCGKCCCKENMQAILNNVEEKKDELQTDYLDVFNDYDEGDWETPKGRKKRAFTLLDELQELSKSLNPQDNQELARSLGLGDDFLGGFESMLNTPRSRHSSRISRRGSRISRRGSRSDGPKIIVPTRRISIQKDSAKKDSNPENYEEENKTIPHGISRLKGTHGLHKIDSLVRENMRDIILSGCIYACELKDVDMEALYPSTPRKRPSSFNMGMGTLAKWIGTFTSTNKPKGSHFWTELVTTTSSPDRERYYIIQKLKNGNIEFLCADNITALRKVAFQAANHAPNADYSKSWPMCRKSTAPNATKLKATAKAEGLQGGGDEIEVHGSVRIHELIDFIQFCIPVYVEKRSTSEHLARDVIEWWSSKMFERRNVTHT